MELMHGKNKKKESALSSQKYVDISEIKNDTIVLKNGSLRSIVLVSSINFELESSENQEALIAGYQGFLNSLDFPIQILIQSRKLDIQNYLNFLKKKEKTSTNELLKMQIAEYATFVENLTDVAQIMSRYFYVVVPFYPIESKETGPINKIFELLNPKQALTEKSELFETYKSQLWQRVNQVSSGLSRMGLQSTPLNTEEIIELLYSSYNPSMESKSILSNLEELEIS